VTSASQLNSATRQISVRSVIDIVLRQGLVSRAELARLTGLSKQTVSDVVRELEAGGFIRERGRIQGATGRSATTYEMRRDAAFVLGVDLGGTKIHAALADIMGGISAEAIEETDRRGGLDVVAQIEAMLKRLAAKAGIARADIRRGAMGSPGVFDAASGRIALAPNIAGLDAIDMVAALGERLGFEVTVENDVNLAAEGEQWLGSCREVKDFVFIALGTGIGMGIVADGRLVRGARGAAGEIAYLPLGGDPYDARGYRFGTLEAALAGTAIIDRYRGLGGRDARDTADVFDRLRHEDRAAEATIDEAARLLAQALMAVRAVIDPQLIVLGGGIGSRMELVERVRRALAIRYAAEPLAIAPSALGGRATIVGAIGTALARLHDDLFGRTADGAQ
jgi:predicted NBD/HSP70 family sugar kinase